MYFLWEALVSCFLYYLAAWLEMAVVRNHVALFVPINILLNAALSWYLYSIAWRLSRAKAIGFFIRSHVLSQPDGVLSDRSGFRTDGDNGSLDGHFHSLEFISLCKRRKQGKSFYIASLLYFGVCFDPERYMTLLPLLLLALLLKQCKKISLWLSTIVSFGLVQADPCLYHWFCSSCRNRRNPGSRHLKYFTGHQICLQSGGLCLWN